LDSEPILETGADTGVHTYWQAPNVTGKSFNDSLSQLLPLLLHRSLHLLGGFLYLQQLSPERFASCWAEAAAASEKI